MKWINWTIVYILFGTMVGNAEAKVYDFEFKQMDLREVISSITQMTNKSVVFSGAVRPQLIDLTLKRVSPRFALNLVLESYGYIALVKQNVIHVMTTAERGPTSTPVQLIHMEHVLADDIIETIKGFLGEKGTVSGSKTQNALILSTNAEMSRKVRGLIQQLDQPPYQVHIQAKIVEVSTTFSRNLGLSWGPDLGDRSRGISLVAPGKQSTLTANFRAAIGNISDLEVQLTAGERNGDVKVVSQPDIITLSGVPATMNSTETFNVRTLASTGGAGSSAPVDGVDSGGVAAVGGLQSVTAGLTLSVTPDILNGDRVKLKIDVSKSDPDFSSPIDGIPGIIDNSASTTLMVESGQMATIAGLITSTSSLNKEGFPFLQSLPILGYLFGKVEAEKKDSELMIFLTPTIFQGRYRFKSNLNYKGNRTAGKKLETEAFADGTVIGKDEKVRKTELMDDDFDDEVIPPMTAKPPVFPSPETLAPKKGSLLPDPNAGGSSQGLSNGVSPLPSKTDTLTEGLFPSKLQKTESGTKSEKLDSLINAN